ncbi:hypothetical protein DL98DRAFT_576869 [Cadophora sp. DSE1049]|nr:hypothetical protein DL98DRAFT_576869 [Cadophora sp. DSE1049]
MDAAHTAKKLAKVKRKRTIKSQAKVIDAKGGSRQSKTKVKTEDTETSSPPHDSYHQTNEHDTESRVAQKEHIAELEKTLLRQLQAQMEKYGSAIPECRPWLEHADEIAILGQLPRIPIGLLGHTGSGKSSLVNALVDEEVLLPTNGMRASTAVVVELSYNQSTDPTKAYTASVEFCSPEEWAAEFRILRDDIEGRPEGENLLASSTSDAGVALAKLKAVYPGKPTAELLQMTKDEVVQDTNLSGILGKAKTIDTANAKEFSKAIAQYIDSANKTSKSSKFEYWPLVRLVKVYIKASLLKEGLVLVDLPGLGDSNSGRAAVAENYIKHLKSVWVIADINRAVDDKVAQDLLGASFKRQLLLNGNYHERFVTFVMTRIDNLNTDEVMNNLSLNNTVLRGVTEKESELIEELEETLEQVEAIDEEYEHANSNMGSKRKFANMDDDARKEKKRLQNKICKLRSEIAASKLSMRVQCISERNRYTQDRLKADFQYGIASLVQELADAGDESADDSIHPTSICSQGADLKTFCVSSKAFQKAKGRFKRDPEIQGFLNIADTGIPSLAKFARHCTLGYREVAVDIFHTEMALWKFAVKTWAEQDFQDATLTEAQRDRLLAQLDYHYETLKESDKRARGNMAENVRRYMRDRLAPHMERAVKAGADKAENLAEKKTKANMAAGTWKAIIRREGGPYLTSKTGSYHWNEEFVFAYMDQFLSLWRDFFFEQKLPWYHWKYSNIMTAALGDFQVAFGNFVADTCGSYPPIQHILDRIPLQKGRVLKIVSDALHARQEKAHDSPKILRRSIKNNMMPFYNEGRQESGKGMLVRMKVSFQQHVDRNAYAMYSDASETIMNELRGLHKALLPETSEKVQKVLFRLITSLRETINSATIHETEREGVDSARSILRHRILREFHELEGKSSQGEIKDELDSEMTNPFDLLDIYDLNMDGEYIEFDDKDIVVLDADPFKS